MQETQIGCSAPISNTKHPKSELFDVLSVVEMVPVQRRFDMPIDGKVQRL